MKTKYTKLFSILLLLFLPFSAMAHQPRDVGSTETVVVDPEISKAYYATLKGEPHVYMIEEDAPFSLYVGITVPQLLRAETDFVTEIFSVNVEGEKQLVERLSAPREEWTEFYEPFAGDDYLSGPEFDGQQEAGKYEIVISSPDNEGQYVLAIGRIESFPLKEIVNTFITLPGIKAEYFDKPWYSAFSNLMTVFVGITVVLIVGILWGILRYIRNRKVRHD